MSGAELSSLRCWAEIDLAALRHNARLAARLAGGAERVIAVVKADAYGHGVRRVAQELASEVGVLAVANVDEAGKIAEWLEGSRILILSPALESEYPVILAGGYVASMSTREEVRAFHEQAGRMGRKGLVNLVVDTGMGRMGVLPEGAAELAQEIVALPWLELVSVCSHFPSSDEDEVFTRAQEAHFRELLAGLPDCVSHIANSAAIMHPGASFDGPVRAGLMLYGVAPDGCDAGLLRPVLTWKTRVTLVRTLPAGWGISYGRTHILEKPTRVATLAAGYGDGYPRQVSGHGAHVLLHGQRCPILGRVTMDQIMVDATGLPEVHPGDEAVLLGKQGVHSIGATELARQAATIPWHVLTGITGRTRRLYCGDGK